MSTRGFAAALAAAAAVAVGACDDATSNSGEHGDAVGSCSYLGETYEDGETFKSEPDCAFDDCGCDNGGITCLLMPCGGGMAAGGAPGTTPGGECSYDGQVYQDGEEFPLGDGCSTCYCESGTAWCALVDCSGAGGAAGAAGAAGDDGM